MEAQVVLLVRTPTVHVSCILQPLYMFHVYYSHCTCFMYTTATVHVSCILQPLYMFHVYYSHCTCFMYTTATVHVSCILQPLYMFHVYYSHCTVWVTKKNPFFIKQRPRNGNVAFRFRARSVLHITVFIFAAWAKLFKARGTVNKR